MEPACRPLRDARRRTAHFRGVRRACSQFTSAASISNILVQLAVLMVISSGLTVAVASGEFDLSVGQVAGLSSVLVVWSGLPIALSVLSGVAIGVVNGLLVTRLPIPSLIATLAMGPIALGANYAYDGGDSIYASFPRAFYAFATGRSRRTWWGRPASSPPTHRHL